MSVRKIGVPTLLGLLIAAVGIITPIIWDHYKTRSALELQYISSTSLVQVGQTIDNLTVLYKSKKIPNITKVNFALLNSGRLPIRGQDIVTNPQITFSPSNEILELRVERVTPPELEITPRLDVKKNLIEMSFPLLNKLDRIEFSVLVSGINPTFNASTRISGISNLQVIDKTSNAGNKYKNISWKFYVVAPLTAFIIFIFFIGLNGTGREQELLRLWSQGIIKIPNELSIEEIRIFIDKTFRPIKTENDLKGVYNYISNLNIQKDTKLESRHIEGISNEITKAVKNLNNTIFALIVIGSLSIIGIWYLMSVIFQ